MLNTMQNIHNLEAIVKNYTTFFLLFDIVFFILIFACIVLSIFYLNSKKKLEVSDDYIKYIIQGQE